MPCVTRDDAQAPFTTAAGMQAWQAEHGGSILDAAFAYQSGISGWDQKRIMDWSLHLLDVIDVYKRQKYTFLTKRKRTALARSLGGCIQKLLRVSRKKMEEAFV